MDILIAEDDTTSRLSLEMTLRKLGHQVTAVDNGRAALEAWQRQPFPLLISDWMMPGLDGLELCRAIRATQRQQYTYILMLTALGGKTNYLAGMEAGADDFITKPFDEDLLQARLHAACRFLRLHEELCRDAAHDRLTGLLNRGAILDFLQQTLDRQARDGGSTAVLLVDLDHFKSINDTHGHLSGDAVLVEAAQRMRALLRPYDRIGRYGGEEFLVVLPASDVEQAAGVAERIRAAVAAGPVRTPTTQLPVSASLGVAEARGEQVDMQALIASADAALYRAKQGGRNRVECAAPD